MRCKIVRFQKLMWRNIMKSTKSQKASVLHYSIDVPIHFIYYFFILFFFVTRLRLRQTRPPHCKIFFFYPRMQFNTEKK